MKKRMKAWLLAFAAAVFMLTALPFPGAGNLVDVSAGSYYTVSVASGYLALRSAMIYDSSNEIGRLYNGDTVEFLSVGNSEYWWVYSPKYNCNGYVNCNYLIGGGSGYAGASGSVYGVTVANGYLALRNAKAFDSRNEIGQLYNGDTVTVQDSSDATYWWVYSPKYNCNGYVNKNYLYYISGGYAPAPAAPTGGSYTVSVASGYLALRSAKAYDSRNEIGQLYNGDTVTALDTSDATYWWVYSPKYNCNGYVNRNYLIGSGGGSYNTSSWRTVSVASGYLALRTAKAFDSRNEIGQLYSGDTVQVLDSSDGTYWWVYSPKYGRNGYVNRNYLY